MGKRVIITGATSMLGSALVRRCEAEGDEVYAVLRPESGQIANLAGTGAVRVSLALEDWREHLTEKIREAAGNVPCDILYHFAWNGTYGDSRRDPAQQQKNVEYTKTAFQTAAELGCSTFVGAGSQAEFGPYDIPLSDALEKRPVTEYGKAKLAAWQAVLAMAEGVTESGAVQGTTESGAAQKRTIRVNWGRILSAYGPGDHTYTLIGSTLRKLLNQEQAAFTKGEQIWDFIHADDAARAFSMIGDKGVHGKAYTIGCGEGRPLRTWLEELYTVVHDRYPDTPEPLFGAVPYFPDQVMHLVADISELTKDTGFRPEITFAEGIRKLLESDNHLA